MTPFFGMAPPMPLGPRVFVAVLGFALTAFLAHRFRGRISGWLWVVGIAGVGLVVVALEAAGFHEPKGELAFLLGMAAAVVVALVSRAAPQEQRSTRPSASAFVGVGIGVSLVLFGFWYWQTGDEEIGWVEGASFFVVLLIIGMIAGGITAMAVCLLQPRPGSSGGEAAAQKTDGRVG